MNSSDKAIVWMIGMTVAGITICAFCVTRCNTEAYKLGYDPASGKTFTPVPIQKDNNEKTKTEH